MSQEGTVDPRIAIWNVLHDGEITVVSEEDREPLTIFVSIPYIRRRLQPVGDSFVLTLKGLKRAEFQHHDGTITSLREEIETNSPEILSTDSNSMPVQIDTVSGDRLVLDFESIDFALDTGQKVTYEKIAKACEDYWEKWEKWEKGAKEGG